MPIFYHQVCKLRKLCRSGWSNGPTATTHRESKLSRASSRRLDEKQNLIILTYATPDGDRAFRKERALTSFTGDERGTTAALDVSETNLSSVDDPEKREQYAAEVRRMAEKHDPSETI
jgi:hypothetical protein